MNKYQLNKIKGVSIIEYVLLVAGIVIVVYLALGPMATAITGYITKVENLLNGLTA